MVQMQLIFYDKIDTLCLVYQISERTNEYLKFINDRRRNLNLFYLLK